MGFLDEFLLDRSLANLFDLHGLSRDLFFALENSSRQNRKNKKIHKTQAKEQTDPKQTDPNRPIGFYKYSMYKQPSKEEQLWKFFEKERIKFDERKNNTAEKDNRSIHDKAIDKMITNGSTNKYVLQEIEERKIAESARRGAVQKELDIKRMEEASKKNEAIKSLSDEDYWKEIHKRVAEKMEKKRKN